MKTAMQELIDRLSPEQNGIKLIAESLLEKEKEQIMNDYKEGVNKGILYCNGEIFISKEEYYNQNYNQIK
jgi:hypothetical protein